MILGAFVASVSVIPSARRIRFASTSTAGDTWFDLEVMAWYDCTDMPEFLDCVDIMATNGITLGGNSNSPEVPMRIRRS